MFLLAAEIHVPYDFSAIFVTIGNENVFKQKTWST